MANLHGMPDTIHEMQSTDGDLLPACVVSTTWPITPGSGLTLPAFPTKGYVRGGTNPRRLIYVEQPAAAVTLSGSDGHYWLGVHADTHSAVSGWTRQPGTHYVWRPSATAPADPTDGLLFAHLTIVGSTITLVEPLAAIIALASAWRAFLGLGTLATQNANAVAITGGGANFTAYSSANAGFDVSGTANLNNAVNVGGALRAFTTLQVDQTSRLSGHVGIGTAPTGELITILYNKATETALSIKQSTDTGGGGALYFLNAAGTAVGSILTTGSATSFNTSSDVRLKEAVQTLTGALAAVRALRPVTFRWKGEGTADEGLLAHEVLPLMPHAVTGLPDAVDAQGHVAPQQLDYTKLVVWLVGAVQELLGRLEALEGHA